MRFVRLQQPAVLVYYQSSTANREEQQGQESDYRMSLMFILHDVCFSLVMLIISLNIWDKNYLFLDIVNFSRGFHSNFVLETISKETLLLTILSFGTVPLCPENLWHCLDNTWHCEIVSHGIYCRICFVQKLIDSIHIIILLILDSLC